MRSEPAWLENKRPLFTVALEPVSTMYTVDEKLARFFETCARKLAVYTGSAVEENASVLREVRFANTETKATPASSHLDTTTGKLLSNAIKSLLLVEGHAVVQFFPALARQFLEILLVSSAMSQLETSTSVPPESSHWLALCEDMVPGGACDLAKTAVG